MGDASLAIVTGTHRFPESFLAQAEPCRLGDGDSSIAAHRRGDLLLVNRHGVGDRVPVHRVDHVANVRAIAAHTDRVLAVGSCGSLRRDLRVGSMIAVDDVFAPWATPTLFDDARAESLPGFDTSWRNELISAWRGAAGVPIHDTGTYVQSLGPRFETAAEVRFYATVGDVVGMTLASEMVVAREAGVRYAAICAVDNLANGVGDAGLTLSEVEASTRVNHERLWAAVLSTVAVLGVEL